MEDMKSERKYQRAEYDDNEDIEHDTHDELSK